MLVTTLVLNVALVLVAHSSPSNSPLINCLSYFDHRILEKLYLGNASPRVLVLFLWLWSISELL